MHTNGCFFIAVEGCEGTGKSLQTKWMVDYVRDRMVECIGTREPGGTDLGEAIRSVIMGKYDEPMTPLTEYLLFAAAREQHLAQKIRPALDRGSWVITDRYFGSSLAYQCAGRGVVEAKTLHDLARVQGILMPCHTIILDADPEITLERVKKRGSSNRFDDETLAFHSRIRAAYKFDALTNLGHATVIDASDEPEAVFQEIRKVLDWALEQQAIFLHRQRRMGAYSAP